MIARIFSIILLISISNILFSQDTTQLIVSDRVNSKEQEEKPYVILISADGFRYDFADKFNANNLQALRKHYR